jgi:hypothetical protein
MGWRRPGKRASCLHIDLNDQMPGRYNQDLRFGSANPKSAFWLVKFLEDVGYQGPRHFDAHADRTEDCIGAKDFARGCMRTYLILKEKAAGWNADSEIQAILQEISSGSRGIPTPGKHSPQAPAALLTHVFDKDAILKKRLPYEQLDQLTIDILLGVHERRLRSAAGNEPRLRWQESRPWSAGSCAIGKFPSLAFRLSIVGLSWRS